jgi:hypothetical protein
MAIEVHLNPGWFLRDVRLAATRIAPSHRRSLQRQKQGQDVSSDAKGTEQDGTTAERKTVAREARLQR